MSDDASSRNVEGPADVVLCRCGVLMRDWVDLPALARLAGPDPRAASVREQAYSCFGEGLAAIVELARTRPVLVAACAPALHGETLARALEQAGLPRDRARLVDVRGDGFACRGRARGTELAAARLADELERVRMPPEPAPAPEPRVTVVGGSPAADETAALLEACGIAVDWLEDPPESGDGRATRVERTARGFRIERASAEPLSAGALVLAFEPADRAPEAMRPAFEPGPQVLDLATAEVALEQNDVAESGLPADGPPVVALVTGCLPATRTRAPGVALARAARVALALHERWPRTRLVLFRGDDAGAPPGLDALLADLCGRAGGTIVRGAVYRGIYSEGAIHVHATDAGLARRVMLAADLCIVDPGQQDDPRAKAWCDLLGIPDPTELSGGDVFTRVPGVLVASGPGPLSAEEAALRGAACAAHCLALLAR